MTSAYPLTWPPEQPRTPRRDKGPFKTTLTRALENVRDSLRRLAADTGQRITNDQVVISSNVTLGVQNPADPGVAVYFPWEKETRCIAVDRFDKIEHNLQAIHLILEARRTEHRYGGIVILRRTFSGFLALPPPGGKHWTEVLGLPVDATVERIEQVYRHLARIRHPDHGGSDAQMAELNLARDQAVKERGHG